MGQLAILTSSPGSVEQAFDLIRDNADQQLDPEVARLFLERRLDVLEIYTQYSDLPIA
jgi:HD-GYP domain-containing protein (c-di-GMP phosphodiesterase class II)